MKKTLATIFVGALALGGVALLDSKEAPAIPLEPTIAQKLAQEEQVFAHITNGVVDATIVITQTTLDTEGGWYLDLNADQVPEFYPKEEFVQTSTKGTVRKNYAGKGDVYDKNREAFIANNPQNERAIFDETTVRWKQPPLICDGFASTTCHY